MTYLRKVRLGKILAVGVFGAAASLYAGGFYFQIGNPDASPEAKSKNAALVIKVTGCHDPASATVTGTVIRYVDNRPQTSPIRLLPMKEPGAYAVVRDWPSDSAVTLEFVGKNGPALTSALVRARGDVIERTAAKFYPRLPTATEEQEMASVVR
jgi:hypothetical protein